MNRNMEENRNRRTVVVIGGGMGGLFTAAFLSREGCRVTVLEKNSVIGGGLQTFRRYGLGFETGMHILGGIRPGGPMHKVCHYLGLLDKLAIRDVDHDCMDQVMYASDGMVYRVPEGKEAFISYFSKLFPEEAAGIRAYVEALHDMVDEIDFFHLRPTNEHVYTHSESFMWAANRFVAHYVRHPKLRDVLSYMNPMFGGVGDKTPTYIHALINVLCISGPGRFAGDSQQMAEALRKIIEDAGGKVVAGDRVNAMQIDDRRVSFVKTEEGRSYVADHYVSAIHPAEMLKLTDSRAFSKAYRRRIAEAPNSYSSFCAYFVFKPGRFPYINHTCYFQKDYGYIWNYREYNAEDWPRGFMYMTPAELHQGKFATKLIVTAIMPYDITKCWAETQTGHRGAAYEEWKENHLERIAQLMEQIYPGFNGMVAHRFASSPLTIRDYYGEPEGALYGLFRDCNNIAQSQVPVFTKVSNLWMTGQNVNLHGFCGVPLTAIQTAEAIVGRNVIVNKINEAYAQR